MVLCRSNRLSSEEMEHIDYRIKVGSHDPFFVSNLRTTPHNSTCSQEADTEMTKFFTLFWLNISVGKGKMLTCLHSATRNSR